MDKVKDVNVVVVLFCGIEFFNVYDWSIDLDFSWMKFDGLGGVYLGFLEVFGFVLCDFIDIFVKMCNNVIVIN